jgi:hypothetical protein
MGIQLRGLKRKSYVEELQHFKPTFPGQSEHLIRHSVPFVIFKAKRLLGYSDLIDSAAIESHLGGSIRVTPTGDAAAPTTGGTDWLVGGLDGVTMGPEGGTGGTELA